MKTGVGKFFEKNPGILKRFLYLYRTIGEKYDEVQC